MIINIMIVYDIKISNMANLFSNANNITGFYGHDLDVSGVNNFNLLSSAPQII